MKFIEGDILVAKQKTIERHIDRGLEPNVKYKIIEIRDGLEAVYVDIPGYKYGPQGFYADIESQDTYLYLWKYFYTPNELRKLKIKKLEML